MKSLILTLVLTLGLNAFAADPITCKIKSGLGDAVTGVGSDILSAKSNASHKCFDKHLDAFQTAKGFLPDDDTAGEIMNACVNANCI